MTRANNGLRDTTEAFSVGAKSNAKGAIMSRLPKQFASLEEANEWIEKQRKEAAIQAQKEAAKEALETLIEKAGEDALPTYKLQLLRRAVKAWTPKTRKRGA